MTSDIIEKANAIKKYLKTNKQVISPKDIILTKSLSIFQCTLILTYKSSGHFYDTVENSLGFKVSQYTSRGDNLSWDH